ncbi:alpha-(1,3)-fucosyltransferase 9-like [Sparus aurata]|uniref:Fucosyltransferase n=1 Tax=Sparus aurata TaxID=8175 RepID=A0A671VRC3_SPAAU|nr:alpha-(1,3)-fucosyltransferase 9-like [Sparus aurata]XP_030296146.1 alpha-(1,3)-fucosyltransferase 9-like [Sparus aurata]XP_030296147.1 alpha-(1,3)-fucosyltransferase 9-like [Sparus aurata]XP_030296148.1 alpha-(1,3)-fucosyltransferase 9-like [Sparus aurata]
MPLSDPKWKAARTFGFRSLIVLCFLGGLFTYYKLDIKFVKSDMRARQVRPPVLCVPGDSNCSTEWQHNQPQEAAAVDMEPDTILLIWMWPFGYKFDLNCSDFKIKKCHLTDNKALYDKAHGVLFHHREIHGNLENLPKEPSPWFQKWVWLNMESPANSGPIPEITHLFNLTSTYRLDSNVPVPYGHLEPVTSEDESFKIPAKDKLVCWIVSNWKSHFRRVQFYNELKKHVHIHTYGKAFGSDISDQDYSKIVPTCKFYLSFENSVYKDYITEKLYSPMKLGTVPIVLGTSRQNYEEHIPGDSFIHVDDFSTPKKLADRLLYLDKNNSEYTAYFNWTKKFKVKMTWFGKEHACKTCGYIQKHRVYEYVHDLNKWYWD